MASIELACPYYFQDPSGTQQFNLNLVTDPNFVGYVDDITGLDMAGIRENAQTIPAGDGGHHGTFWRDRRPFTFSGFVMPSFSLLARDQAQETIESVIGSCLSDDGQVLWTPADGVQKYVNFRAQQPVRMTTGQSKVQKKFTIAGVVADWRIRSAAMNSITSSGGFVRFGTSWETNAITATGAGNCDALPIFRITGPINTMLIANSSYGKGITINYNLPSGAQLIADLTGEYPSITLASSGASLYGYVDPLNTDWNIAVRPGANVLYVREMVNQGSGNTGNSVTKINVQWQDSWH